MGALTHNVSDEEDTNLEDDELATSTRDRIE